VNVLVDILTWVCVAFVIIGAIPVAAGLYQYLLVPFHAHRNHYRKAAPYLPRVAVVVPAWNEGAVVGTSIDRLVRLEYPPDRLRIYVVDDASTDDTPDVVLERAARYPGRVFHLRRDKGGQGKAHTLNHGITVLLEQDWMEALLIMDADVIYRPDSLRKMTRHLADPNVGAVTAFICEGSANPKYMTRFIGYEYVASQAAARRAQNVLGVLACLAGGAQLHSRENLVAIGGRIDTTTLAEDTISTLLTQLNGRRVVFEPYAVVLAEEPEGIGALWKQRLRWGRGNVQVSRRFKHLWFRPWKHRGLGGFSFGIIWFSVLLLPVTMILSSIGLIGLFLLGSDLAAQVFRATWFLAACTYLFITVMTVQIDARTGRRSWREAIAFPGIISLLVMITAFAPELFFNTLPGLLGLRLTAVGETTITLALYAWLSLCMPAAWLAKRVETTRFGKVLAPALIYLVGYGPLLCAITFDSYIKEFKGAAQVWDKTEKVGRVMA
jgi:cellulose synthase/poly-beta-1,6-N-acetylglucosamine synthase-like glycosyltransferase